MPGSGASWYGEMFARAGLAKPHQILRVSHHRMPDPVEPASWVHKDAHHDFAPDI